MPAFSRDLERTLSKAITIADEKGQVRATPLHVAHFALCETYPHEAAAKMATVAKLAREHQHPLHCIMESQEV